MNNAHQSWTPGQFIDSPHYDYLPPDSKDDWKAQVMRREALVVRPHLMGDALCECRSPDVARWIAERLNLAAQLERDIADAYLELRKIRPAVKAIFDRAVWDRAQAREDHD